MEATQAKLEISYDEALMNFDCDKDKNIADKENPPTFLFNNEQVTAESYSIHENTISCLKDFDTVLNNVRQQNSRINTSTSNVSGVEDEVNGSSLETLCDDIDQASASIETWKNIYENFAQTNECKNICINTGDGLDGISKIGDNKTYLNTNIQIVSKDLTEHKSEIVETQPYYTNGNTKIIENNSTKVYRFFENVSKKTRKKRHINVESICKKVCSQSIRKQINKSINLKKQNVVSSQIKSSKPINIENENISISHNEDENLRSNGNILKNETRDIISISSDESVEDIEFDSDGYKSSDFEFINETEAAKDIPRLDDFEELTNTSDDKQSANEKELYQEDMIINDYLESLYPIIDTNKSDVNYRENHTIPVGEDYFNLFSGNHTPYPMYSFENKSTSLSAGMNVERGFDLDMFGDDSTPEQHSEAKETKRKILSMYYVENRSRRQSRR